MKQETFEVLAKMFSIANNTEGDSISVELVLDHLKRMTVLELLPSKIGKFDLWDVTTKDGVYASIYYKGGFAYATNTRTLFKIRSEYDSNLEEKKVFKDGKIREGMRMVYEDTIATSKARLGEKKRGMKLDMARLKEVDKEVRALKKILGRDFCPIISFKGRVYYKYEDLLNFFKFMETFGIESFDYYSGEESLVPSIAESDNGCIGVIMPLSGDFRQRRDVIKW